MDFAKLKRLPHRIRQDITIISLAKNWREILWAKAAKKPYLTINLRNGVVFNSPPEVSLDFLFHEIWLDEFYSGKGYEIKSNEIVVDIGANIGVFAMWAATRAKNVLVFAFEPFPMNAEYFLANQRLSKLDKIKLQAVAVADAEGTRTLRVAKSWIMHSLSDTRDEKKGIKVNCISLDQALEEIKTCHFLKLDCEGGEYEILYSASPQTLKKIQRIICEYNIKDTKQRNGEALSRFLKTNGFLIDTLESSDGESGVLRARRNRA